MQTTTSPAGSPLDENRVSAIKEIRADALITTVEPLHGKILADGTIQKQVFFIDAEDIVREIEETVPFSAHIPAPGTTPDSEATVNAEIENITFRLVEAGQLRQTVTLLLTTSVFENGSMIGSGRTQIQVTQTTELLPPATTAHSAGHGTDDTGGEPVKQSGETSDSSPRELTRIRDQIDDLLSLVRDLAASTDEKLADLRAEIDELRVRQEEREQSLRREIEIEGRLYNASIQGRQGFIARG